MPLIKINFWRDWILSRSKTWWNACMGETTSKGATLLSKENPETISLYWQVGFTDFYSYHITNICLLFNDFFAHIYKNAKLVVLFVENITDWVHEIIIFVGRIILMLITNIYRMLSICPASYWIFNREILFQLTNSVRQVLISSCY